MEIINRAEAKRRDLNRYYTGEPCKNGHIAYRYTQSGTCFACIRAAGSATYDADRPVRNEALSQLVQAKFRLFRDDVELFTSAAYAFAVMRFPVLRKVDVYPGLLPLDNDPHQGLYKCNCHSDDLLALRTMADDLIKTRAVDGEVERSRVHGAAAKVAMAPVPDWARVPRPGDFDYK
jgi:hypothetical protein